MLIEICCDSLAAVDAAVEGGAQRVELCAELALDGLTPPDALVRHAVSAGIRTHVLIRPRAGDFVYSDLEAEAMLVAIRRARLLGAHGVTESLSGLVDVVFHFEDQLLDHLYGVFSLVDQVVDVCLQDVCNARKNSHKTSPFSKDYSYAAYCRTTRMPCEREEDFLAFRQPAVAQGIVP